ncbi:hypothetical protein HKW73_30560, partial [Pseudomonas aeruginosa]|nr:hypothetical protein [Pseudomonas aeruginosa]
MQIDLSDKLAIVSGSTAGIGFAIVSGLAAAGFYRERHPAARLLVIENHD